MEVVGFSTELIKEMKSIKDDLECINLHMVDTDTILTPEDEGILKEGLEEFETGKTISLSDLKRDRDEGNRTPAILQILCRVIQTATKAG